MSLFFDTWNPAYGSAMDAAEDGPSESSSAQLDTDVEVPADEWRPLTAPAAVRVPDVVHFVDGVRRLDALGLYDDTEHQHLVLAASYAAGVICCDLRAGAAELVASAIGRGLFSPAPQVTSIGVPPARYTAHHVEKRERKDLENAAQHQMQALEVEVSSTLKRRDDLLVIDGPLSGRARLPNSIGYIKTHRRQYLPDRLSTVVTGLNAGQRSPIFLLGTNWRTYTWYLRLPAATGSSWAGIVRVECSSDLAVGAAIEVADQSTATLPRFASCAYKDPRAPQNLVPIAGLERRLRAMLGDARILRRALVRGVGEPAAAPTGAAPTGVVPLDRPAVEPVPV